MKYDNYVEEIKRNRFYAVILEFGLESIIFKLNISVYISNEQNNNVYKHFTNIWCDISDKNYNIILIFYSNNNHYDLLTSYKEACKSKGKNILANYKNISNDKITFNKVKFTKNYKFNFNNNKLYSIKKNCYYYDNILNYLLSYKINTINGKTNWRKIVYPKELNDKSIKKSLLDKRRQNFRTTCSNFILKDNNNLYYRKKIDISSDTFEEKEKNIKEKK